MKRSLFRRVTGFMVLSCILATICGTDANRAFAQTPLSQQDSLRILSALVAADSIAAAQWAGAPVGPMAPAPAPGFTDPDKLREERSHTGWKASPFPILSYNSDLGVQIGAFVDVYDYGKPENIYPEYYHRFHAEASYYTRGQVLLNAEYDSSHLIPNVRGNISVTYSKNPLCQFFGIGGDVEVYDSSLDRKNSNACYSINRNMLRVLTSFQGQIVPHFNWVSGVSFWKYDISDINFADYNPANTVYRKYVASGVINPGEARGGSVLELRAGLSWDTRDFEPSPSKGARAELYFCGAPGVGGNKYLKLCADIRGFWTPGPDWLTLAGHLAYQGVIAGNQPFYTMQHIYTLTPLQCYAEGLGGLNTIRGMLSTRLLGDGYAWANLETRFRIYTIKLRGYELYIGANPFVDLGCIVQPSRLEALSVSTGESIDGLRKKASSLHVAPGAGLKFGFNKNTIMSVEVAKSLKANDGPVSVAVSMNYIF